MCGTSHLYENSKEKLDVQIMLSSFADKLHLYVTVIMKT